MTVSHKTVINHCIRFISLLIFLFYQITAYSQERRPLDSSTQDRIERLEELVTLYTNRNEPRLAATYLTQISNIYLQNQRQEFAAQSFLRAAVFYEQINDLDNLDKIYANVGLIYVGLENLTEADRAFSKNVEIQRRTGDRKSIARALVDQAYIKNLRNEYRDAVNMLEEALSIALEINQETVLPTIYRQLSFSYDKLNNTRKSEEFHKKYVDMRDYIAGKTLRGEFREQQERSQVEILLQQAEAKQKEVEMELERVRFEFGQDSISRIVQAKEDSLIEVRRIETIQRQEIELLENQAKLIEAEIERQQAVQKYQQQIIYSALGGLVFVLILALFIYRSNVAKRKANKILAEKNIQIELANDQLTDAFEKIEEQNFRITQSISYAREIQRALFPPIETLSNFLPESFIFFRPVDIVSGDFYWFKDPTALSVKTNEENTKSNVTHHENGNGFNFKGEQFVISAVDCTGHGVPGAFMSMIGYNLLDAIIGSGTTKPDRILGKLHHGVVRALKQDETTNRDGMDISLCIIDKLHKTVEFAGANNPVIKISNGELEVIKGDRMAIGGSNKRAERVFTPHTMTVDAPTTFYIMTDGFTDQFGGEEGKKFSMKSFTELLQGIHHLPMNEQRQVLEDKFLSWKGDGNQIDDVLVIGFRLS